MENIYYFEYYKAAKKMGLPQDIIMKIEKDVRNEFPDDKMMFELRVLRALKSRHWDQLT